jgi:uncharacterized protein involved in outer membrane biogenesis
VRAVQARTGRVLHIGNLDVDLGRTSTIRADAITFANASWAKQRMASADRVEIDVRVWPLLRGSVQLPEVRLTRPDVLLETAPRKGEPGNWDFLGDSAGGTSPQLKRLRIDDGRLQFLDALGRTDIRVGVRSGQPKQADASPPLLVQGKGHWQATRSPCAVVPNHRWS